MGDAVMAVQANGLSDPDAGQRQKRMQMAADAGIPDFSAQDDQPSMSDVMSDLDALKSGTKDRSKISSAIGTAGKAAAGAALIGGAVVGGAALGVASKSRKGVKKATDSIGDGLMSILLETMSYSDLEKRVAEKESGSGRGSKKDGGFSL